MKLLYAAASIAAALLAAAIATSGLPLSEPFYYMPVATLTLVAIGMLYLTFKRKENSMSDNGTHTQDVADASTANPATPAVVSHSPTRYMAEKGDYVQEFFGIGLLLGVIAVLLTVVYGMLDFDGSVNIHGLFLPYIVAVVLAAQWIYKKQERISFIRPTGPKAGRVFGWIDLILSGFLALVAWVMFAGVIVRWLPPQIRIFWDTYASFIPIAPYTTTCFIVGIVFAVYGGRDVAKQLLRGRVGRDALIQRKAEEVVGAADHRVITVPKSKVPHGFALFRRKPNLDIDYDNGPLSVG